MGSGRGREPILQLWQTGSFGTATQICTNTTLGLTHRYVDGSLATLASFVTLVPATEPAKDATHAVQAVLCGLVDRRHQQELSYKAFVSEYMRPNRPVIIQAQHLISQLLQHREMYAYG